MIMRTSYLESRTTLGNSGQRSSDVRISDPITGFLVEFRCANGATHNQAALMAQCIDAIEVVDGADVLFSIDGPEAFGLQAYRSGHLAYHLISELPNVVQNLVCWIPFGRYYGDTEYALDPTRFNNPQVRVSWNLANVQAVGATGFADGGLSYTVLAHVMQGASKPRAMLTTREHYAWTTASSGVEYIDLPTDRRLVALLVRATKAAYAVAGVVNHLKLQADSNRVVLLDQRMTDTIRDWSLRYPPFQYKHQFHAADGDTLYMALKQDEVVSFTQGSQQDTTIAYTNNGIGEGAIQLDSAGSAQGSDVSIDALVFGFCPLATVYLPFGLLADPSTWLAASDFRSLRAEITGAVASGSGYLVLVQERVY